MSKDQKSEAYPKITEDPNYTTMATLPGSVKIFNLLRTYCINLRIALLKAFFILKLKRADFIQEEF